MLYNEDMEKDEKKTYRTAITDDDPEAADRLRGFLERYAAERGADFDISVFRDGAEFSDSIEGFDIVFMDVDMPYYNGIKTAERMRKTDPSAALVFVTNLAQFAIEGYKVGASDYLVKPVGYPAFAMTMDEILPRADALRSESIELRSNYAAVRVPVGSVLYVESRGHRMIWHTDSGDVETWGSMKAIEEMLPSHFARCNVSMLVNLERVTGIDGGEVTVGGVRLPISRHRKKDFTAAVVGAVGNTEKG